MLLHLGSNKLSNRSLVPENDTAAPAVGGQSRNHWTNVYKFNLYWRAWCQTWLVEDWVMKYKDLCAKMYCNHIFCDWCGNCPCPFDPHQLWMYVLFPITTLIPLRHILCRFIFLSKTFFLPFTCVHFSIKIMNLLAVFLIIFTSSSLLFTTTWWFVFESLFHKSPLNTKTGLWASSVRDSDCVRKWRPHCVWFCSTMRTACIWVSEWTRKGEDRSSANSQKYWELPGSGREILRGRVLRKASVITFSSEPALMPSRTHFIVAEDVITTVTRWSITATWK